MPSSLESLSEQEVEYLKFLLFRCTQPKEKWDKLFSNYLDKLIKDGRITGQISVQMRLKEIGLVTADEKGKNYVTGLVDLYIEQGLLD